MEEALAGLLRDEFRQSAAHNALERVFGETNESWGMQSVNVEEP
jgi:hypothetical protein